MRGSIGRSKSRGQGTEGRAMPRSSGAALGPLAIPLTPCPGPALVGRHPQAREGLTWWTSVPPSPPACCLPQGPAQSLPGVLLMHKCLSKLGSGAASCGTSILVNTSGSGISDTEANAGWVRQIRNLFKETPQHKIARKAKVPEPGEGPHIPLQDCCGGHTGLAPMYSHTRHCTSL